METPPDRLDLTKLVPLHVMVHKDAELPGEHHYVVWYDPEEQQPRAASCTYCQGECDGFCEDFGW